MVRDIISILFGIGLLGWVGYNTFIEMLPQAQDKNPYIAVAIGLILIFLGTKNILNKKQRQGHGHS